jgi:hypothetical protein
VFFLQKEMQMEERKKKGVGPVLDTKTLEFYGERFDSINQGITYVLEMFPALYRMCLHDLKGRFLPGELMLMMDVMNGGMLSFGIAGQHLILSCYDGIKLDGLDAKWGIDKQTMLDKLVKLPRFELAALEIWAAGFWRSGIYKDPDGEDKWMAPLLNTKA